MKRRTFLCGLSLGTLAVPLAAEAQPGGKVPRVGVLTGTTQPASPRGNAFVAGLRDFGYVEGQNIAIEWQASGGRAERLPGLAAELVRVNVDVIVAVDNPAIVAAQRATRARPNVRMTTSGNESVEAVDDPRAMTRILMVTLFVPEEAVARSAYLH